ncbi:hypothetical protein N7495_009225 [Penicillium taxi]|uniref:uncharacterized protein n=1 Tax=Penicillium taxi TaxID=168475 RepID=UPI002544F22F|nr:uncharacterized protein N7495_009225 [Penicillium taxi]KAJ5884715.1 hypothetical protein N7495_009225 [Penicillium taxi]
MWAYTIVSSLLLGLLINSPTTVSAQSPKVSTIFQFPNLGSWIEGIAVRPNGQLLVTRLDTPEIWSVDPTTQTAYSVHTFPNATSVIGITPIGNDVYAVGAGVVNQSTFAATAGTFVVWKVDLRGRTPSVSVINSIPAATSLSGMAYFEGSNSKSKNTSLILIADTALGAIWRLNPKTGAYSIAISDASMLPAPYGPPIGINGIRLLGNTLYYTSSTQQEYCSVKLNSDASAASAIQVIASGFFQDGLAITDKGNAYITTHIQNTVIKVTPDGNATVFAGSLNSTAVAGSTDAQFGTYKKKQVLYVTTNGALSSPVNGTFTEPAKVVMIGAC